MEHKSKGIWAIISFSFEFEIFKGMLFIKIEGFMKFCPFIFIEAPESSLLWEKEMLVTLALADVIGLLKSIV